MQYDNTNRGALYKNDYKQKDNQPDYTGPINIDGTAKRVAAWLTKDKNGDTYMSLEITEKKQPQDQGGYPANNQAQQMPSNDIPLDDDIPF